MPGGLYDVTNSKDPEILFFKQAIVNYMNIFPLEDNPNNCKASNLFSDWNIQGQVKQQNKALSSKVFITLL